MSMPKITPGTGTKEQALIDLVESIALEETGISHIINAEGEKLQKVIGMESVNVEQILAINESVENMIKAITELEVILKEKLEITRVGEGI